jgi:HTH-type transcriptional regulator/antitoxin HipB
MQIDTQIDSTLFRQQPDLFAQEIGRRIREARRAQGLTQEEVALAANVATRALHYIEHGRIRPRVDTVQRILSVLGMTLEILPRATRANEEDSVAAKRPKQRQRPEHGG